MFLKCVAVGLLTWLASLSAHPQDGYFEWLNRFESTNSTVGGIASDRAGNVYVVGTYVGSLKIEKRSLPFAKSADIFIAKLTRHGKPVWLNRMDSGSDDSAGGIIVENGGRFFLSGSWGTNSSIHRMWVERGPFVARVDNGKLEWSSKFAEVDQSGIVGIALSPKDQTIWALGNSFVKNYMRNGSVITNFPVTDGCCGSFADIAVGANGNLILTGTLRADLEQQFFVGGSNVTPYASGLQFTVALNSVGQFMWAWGAPSPWMFGSAGLGVSVAVAPDGSVISAGKVLRAPVGLPYAHAFVSKHASDGTLLWMQVRGDHRGAFSALDVAVGSDDNVFMTGYAHDYYYNPANRTGVLIMGYDTIGSPFFEYRVNSVERGDENFGTHICVDAKNNVTVAGFITGSPIIGTNVLASRSSPFVARLRLP